MSAEKPTLVDDQVDVVKWYTKARKFPQLIGRTHDGTRIPGGPYTFTQVIGGAIYVIVASKLIGPLGGFGLLGNVAFVGLTTAALIFALGKMPIGARSPVSVALGLWTAATSPAVGHYRGRVLRAPKTRRARGQVNVMITDPTTLAAVTPRTTTAPAPAEAAPRPRPAPAVPPRPASGPLGSTGAPTCPARPALSGLQQLLASTVSKPERNP